jgi:hypothetical protein
MSRIAAAKPVTAQDIHTGMIFTDGKRVYRAARIVPLNIVGKVVKNNDSVTVETGATHVQIVTRFGFLNLPINAPIVPLVSVSI